MDIKYTIIGTAGHIDHGKSALVKALTGTDPDRLTEEQQRGMTIDLGFAFLNEHTAIIDVPGHERFIKNMVAGVSAIDLVMFVIAADDGVMPQTREHLDILNLLNVKHGLIVITKVDLVDADWLAVVEEDILNLVSGTFLESAPVLPVSSVTGAGIDTLRQKLIEKTQSIPGRRNHGVFWVPIDRSFSIKGFGTVVTGSVLSGDTSVGATLELLPSGKQVKVRGLQTHGKTTKQVQIGERAAINLANIAKDEIFRGDVLASSKYFKASNLFDGTLQLLKTAGKPVKNQARVRVHIGTREILGRLRLLDRDSLEPGEHCYVQLKLELPAVAMRRDPFVIRQYSPLVTIGGGIILDTNPKPRKRFHAETLQNLRSLEKEDPGETLTMLLLSESKTGINAADLERVSGLETSVMNKHLQILLDQNVIVNVGSGKKPIYCHQSSLALYKEQIVNSLSQFHADEPLRYGINKAELKLKSGIQLPLLFEFVLQDLNRSGEIEIQSNLIKLAAHQIQMSPEDKKVAEQIIATLRNAGYSPPGVKELAGSLNISPGICDKILGALYGLGDMIRLDNEISYLRETLESAKSMLVQYLHDNKEITVSQYRDLLNTTRKYSLVLLLYFDQTGITIRVDDVRLLNEDSL